MKRYDYLIVNAGLFCAVVDRINHAGGLLF